MGLGHENLGQARKVAGGFAICFKSRGLDDRRLTERGPPSCKVSARLDLRLELELERNREAATLSQQITPLGGGQRAQASRPRSHSRSLRPAEVRGASAMARLSARPFGRPQSGANLAARSANWMALWPPNQSPRTGSNLGAHVAAVGSGQTRTQTLTTIGATKTPPTLFAAN